MITDNHREETSPLISTIRCSRCRTLCRSRDRYCACCGAALLLPASSAAECATCGAELLTPLANYCSACGRVREER